MRILFIGPLPDPVTGQSIACQRLLDHLRQSHAVDVIDIAKQELRQGVTSFGRIAQVLSFARAARAKASGVDAVYFTIAQSAAGSFRDMLIYLALGPKIARTIVHLHGGAGMRNLMDPAKHPLLAALHRRFLSHVGGIIVLGDSLRGIFASVEGTPIHVVPNFADDNLFLEPEAIEGKFAQPGTLNLLFLSNLIAGKGHEELLDAFGRLSESERERLGLCFAGGFADDDSRDQFLERLGREPRARYAGVVHGEQKQQLLKEAHIFCLPTYYRNEGQPISILEAYASGCAVVTTRHSGIVDIFEDGINGLAVEPRNPESIAAALRTALDDRRALLRFGLANRAAAGERYRLAGFTARVTQLVEQAGASGVPAPSLA